MTQQRLTAEEADALRVERREQKREAQARYRQVHARRMAAARQISKILMRQHGHHDDIEQLATALRKTLTTEGIRALRAELGCRQ